MSNAAKTTKDPMLQSGANYNTGNTYMSEQQWQQAVDAYKQALRKNPQDADAKYNLSYALAKLKKDQQGGGGKDKQQNKDKDQQQKDQQNNKDKQNKEQQDKEGDKQQRPQPQESKISEQQADNLLKALQQDERKVQDKMQQGKGSPVKMEKDW
jgi:tetratricopeptide (TPR) repeat protein